MSASLSRAWLIAGVWLSLLPAWAWGWGNNLQLPPPAPVVDEYGLLSSDEYAQLDQMLRNAKQSSGVEIAVFIPSSLRGREIEDFSIATAEEWKLGRKKEDKAFLLTIAPKERKMRIEVGYGLEGELTDVFTGQVLDNTVRPLFKEGRYYEGIVSALLRIQEKVPLGLDSQSIPQDDLRRRGTPHVGLLFLLILFFMIGLPILKVLAFLAGFRRRTWWGGGGGWGGGGWGGGSSWGSGGGSSWGGGGGGFGGGGSSSNW